ASSLGSAVPPLFGSVDGSSVLVRWTRAGDANLDGAVDLTDFTFLASSFNGTGKVWLNGDFNYDGTVDLTDFTVLASNFNTTAGSVDVGTAVPEPTSIALALTSAALVLPRRGRRRRM